MSRINTKKAVVAGVVATGAMTAVMLMAPAMGLPPMNVGKMLGSVMGGMTAVGWAAHLMIGIVLAVVYATTFVHRLKGPGVLRGALFSVAPWLVAQLAGMPMMGAGVFSGSAVVALASLMGHLVFGAILGAIYGQADSTANCDACAHA